MIFQSHVSVAVDPIQVDAPPVFLSPTGFLCLLPAGAVVGRFATDGTGLGLRHHWSVQTVSISVKRDNAPGLGSVRLKNPAKHVDLARPD